MSAPVGGPGTLDFTDGESVADLATYARRATRLDHDGAMRLQAGGGVLAAWVCVLPGSGLLRSGLVLGLRTMALHHDSPALDVTVPLAALADRFARRAATGDASASLAVPPTTVAPSWAALSAPRGGWAAAGTVGLADLEQAARDGIEEVATGAPEGSGAAAVAALRARVWGRGLVGAGLPEAGVPAGAALALHALGFSGTSPGSPAGQDAEAVATVHRSGPWLRVSTAVGHAVLRP